MRYVRGSWGGSLVVAAMCAAVLLTSGRAEAAATLVRRGSATGTTSVAVNWQTLAGVNQSTTTGNLLVAMIQYNGSGSVTPPAGLGWTASTMSPAAVGSNVSVAIYYVSGANHTSSHSSDTFAVSGSTSTVVQLAEFSGVQSASPLDASNTGTTTPAGASVSATATASAGPSLVIGAFGNDGNKSNQSFASAPTGYTNLVAGDVDTGTTHALNFYRTDGPSGSTTVTGTSGNKPSQMAGVVAIFLVPVTTYYWRGQGGYAARPGSPVSGTCYGYYDDGGCWSTTSGGATGTTAPGTGDNTVFDGAMSSNGGCTISPLAGGTTQANQITVTSGYSGTITQSGNVQTAGAITIGGGTWSISSNTYTINTNKTGSYVGDLNLAGGTFTCNGATVAIRSLAVSGGSYTISGCTYSLNNSGGITVSGGTLTQGTGALSLSTLTVSGGTLNLTDNAANNPDVTVSGAFTQSGGTVNLNAAQLTTGTGVAPGSNGFSMTGGTFNGNTGTLKVTGNSSNSGATTTINGSGAVFDGGTGTQQFAGPLTITSGSMTLYTGSMTSSRGSPPSNAVHDKLVTVNGGTLTLGSPGFSFASTDTMTVAGTVNAGSGAVTFAAPVTLTGTFNTNASTLVTFSDVVTMSGSSAFNGGTGSTTFAVAPTLTAGTFTVGSSGSTGKVTMTAGASFTSGMTLAFPDNGGELATASGQTISVAGIVQSAVTGSTKPKIDCPACTGTQGFTMTITSNATLNIDGLQFDRVSTAGVQIADMSSAKWLKFQNVKFTNNAAQGTASGTHLAITRSSATLRVPGCYFDATAKTNVTLTGVSGSPGVHLIFEDQGSTTSGPRAGEAYDSDGDTSTVQDNIADGLAGTTPFQSIVEWAAASPTDTAGTAVGFPTAAFDWNTFAYIGIYAAYKNVDGANNDTLWKRNNDGSAAYSITFDDDTYSDMIGTPRWDTINETTVAGGPLDVNGDGDSTDTNVHVVYLAFAGNPSHSPSAILPRVIKLIDTGTALARPSAGRWSTDFSSATVKTITSPLIADATNLYFGGTDSSNATKIFGVQIAASSSNEKTLQKNTAAFSTVSATPAWKVYSGNTFLFLGTAASSGTAYVYRMNVTSGTPADASFTGSTTNLNDSIRLINDRAWIVNDGGKVYCLDASNFATGGFTNLSTFNSGSPYSSTAASPMRAGPYIDPYTNTAYVGDNAGNLYVITSAGANLSPYPFAVTGAPQFTSSPMYLKNSGIIAIGAADGYVYFINRHTAANAAAIHKKYFVSSAGSVSTVAYNNNTSQYMVSSSDGKLLFINKSDVTDPDATE